MVATKRNWTNVRRVPLKNQSPCLLRCEYICIPLSGSTLCITVSKYAFDIVKTEFLLLTSRSLLVQKPAIYHKPLPSFFQHRHISIGSSLTFEQHPPNINPSIAPTAIHCGIVSIKIRAARASSLEATGLGSSIPYISAFSNGSLALIILGVITCPSEAAEAWRSRSVDRLRGAGIGLNWPLAESVLRFLAISVYLWSAQQRFEAGMNGGRRCDLTRRWTWRN